MEASLRVRVVCRSAFYKGNRSETSAGLFDVYSSIAARIVKSGFGQKSVPMHF